ncbi:CbiX/SirB N-terminal domain-containing protein [Longispora sp. NPDC051575]|uniref:CbiX/SirB N-terminal domain-containing protein n=1 Tax=Longispora sp. NPDC051575 TaxID=3154943 RepID=UPI0034190463
MLEGAGHLPRRASEGQAPEAAGHAPEGPALDGFGHLSRRASEGPALPALDGVGHSASRPALVLLAHGSRDPRAAMTTEDLALAVSAARPGLDVRVAYLDHAWPRPGAVLADLAASGAGSAVVVPLLLTSAYHGTVDVPAVLVDPPLPVHRAPVVGTDPALYPALLRGLRSAVRARFPVIGYAGAPRFPVPDRSPQSDVLPGPDQLHVPDQSVYADCPPGLAELAHVPGPTPLARPGSLSGPTRSADPGRFDDPEPDASWFPVPHARMPALSGPRPAESGWQLVPPGGPAASHQPRTSPDPADADSRRRTVPGQPTAQSRAAGRTGLPGVGVGGWPVGGQCDGLVVIAAGTSDDAARADLALAAAGLGERLGVPARIGFASGPGPRPDEAVAALYAAGALRVGVASCFLAQGRLYDRARDRALRAGAVAVAEPLGAAPELVAVVLARYAAATLPVSAVA